MRFWLLFLAALFTLLAVFVSPWYLIGDAAILIQMAGRGSKD